MTELTEIGIRSSVKMEEYPNFDFNWGLVVAQLPKWSLPTLDDTGSNPAITIFIKKIFFC